MKSGSDAGYLLGRYGGGALLVFLIIYFGYRAAHSESRSSRFANLALCCVLAGWILTTVSEILWILGGLSGIAGVTLDVLALKARRRDKGTGLVRVIIGLVLSVVSVLGNASYILLPILIDYRIDRDRVALEEPGTGAWIYRSVEHDFQLNLPSPRWPKGESWNGYLSRKHVAFTHPSKVTLSLESSSAQTAGDYEHRASELASLIDRVDRAVASTGGAASVTHTRGVNPKGCRYSKTTTQGRNARSSRIFLLDAIIWCADKQFTTASEPVGALIRLSFSAKPSKRASEALLERTAQFIIDSFEDGS